MKNKNIAAMMAFFLGPLGVHRFYLGDMGKGIGMLVLWRILTWKVAMVIGIIDAIVFLSMDQEEFDKKYNKDADQDTDYKRERRRRSPRRERPDFNRHARDFKAKREAQLATERKKAMKRRETQQRKRESVSPYKKSGIEKFKDFDYEGAIADFEKVSELKPKDAAVHFNLACAYSLTENKEKSFEHLSQAVNLGFKDFKRIKTHDALAFLRVQDGFDEFEANKYQLRKAVEAPNKDILQSNNPDLLEQLNKLNELKQKGLLTDGEFATQKKKLLAE